MEAEFLEDVRVAPSRQQRPAAGAQALGPAARGLGLGQGRAERLEGGDAFGGEQAEFRGGGTGTRAVKAPRVATRKDRPDRRMILRQGSGGVQKVGLGGAGRKRIGAFRVAWKP